MSVEVMCRTNAGTIDFSKAGGGVSELTASEVAGYLNGLSKGAYLAGMCYITGQVSKESVSSHLYDSIKLGIIKIPVKRKGEDYAYTKMSLLAVVEAIGGNVCPACNGTTQNAEHKDFITCNGTGRLNPSDDWRAMYCKVHDWGYWRDGYNSLYQSVTDWLSDAKRKIP